MKTFSGYTKGVNLGGWLSQCVHTTAHYDSFITKDDVKTIASWGVDHIRIPFDYNVVQDDNGFIESGFAYIDSVLEWARECNLNVILDLHKTAGFVFDDYKKATFFTDSALQQKFYDLWEELAKRYGNKRDFVAFELLNEIVDPDVAQIWNGIAAKAIDVIRAHAPTVYILVGGVWNNSIGALPMLDMPRDEYIVYNFHFYEPLVFTHQKAHWVENMPADFSTAYPNDFAAIVSESERFLPEGCSNTFNGMNLDKIDRRFFQLSFEKAVKIAEERNVPLYCGEYGVILYSDANCALNWFCDIHDTFEEYGIGRAVWTYKDMDFGISHAHYKEVFAELVKLL